MKDCQLRARIGQISIQYICNLVFILIICNFEFQFLYLCINKFVDIFFDWKLCRLITDILIRVHRFKQQLYLCIQFQNYLIKVFREACSNSTSIQQKTVQVKRYQQIDLIIRLYFIDIFQFAFQSFIQIGLLFIVNNFIVIPSSFSFVNITARLFIFINLDKLKKITPMMEQIPQTVVEIKSNSTFQKQTLDVLPQIQSEATATKIKTFILSDKQKDQQIQESIIEIKVIQPSSDLKDQTLQSLPKSGQIFNAVVPKNNQQQGVHQLQQTQQGYIDLTTKLQSALSKISSQKKGHAKTKEANQDFIDRSQKCLTKKKQDIQHKKEELQMYKTKQVKEKPTIDKKSDKMMKQMGYEPIYTRFQKIVETRKKKIEELEENKRKKDEEEEALFKEEYNKHMKKPESRRTYNEYYNEMQRWKQKTEVENKQKLQLQKSKQLQGLTFKPIINSKSEQMISNKQRTPIEQRGPPKKKAPSTDFTFSPKINTKKSTKIP